MSESDISDGHGFVRSTFSKEGNCVEVRLAPGGGAAVRHSGDRYEPISFTREEWAAFVAGVKNGEFDPV